MQLHGVPSAAAQQCSFWGVVSLALHTHTHIHAVTVTLAGSAFETLPSFTISLSLHKIHLQSLQASKIGSIEHSE